MSKTTINKQTLSFRPNPSHFSAFIIRLPYFIFYHILMSVCANFASFHPTTLSLDDYLHMYVPTYVHKYVCSCLSISHVLFLLPFFIHVPKFSIFSYSCVIIIGKILLMQIQIQILFTTVPFCSKPFFFVGVLLFSFACYLLLRDALYNIPRALSPTQKCKTWTKCIIAQLTECLL